MASEIKVNKISPGSGTALQISDSGDTVTLPSGATLTIAGTINASTGTATGFGAIDWQTSDIKTSTFTAVAGKGYIVNTTGGAVTVTLPASAGTVALTSDVPSAGISSGNVATFTSGVADDDFLRVAGTAVEGRSASEVLSDMTGVDPLLYELTELPALGKMFPVTTFSALTILEKQLATA